MRMFLLLVCCLFMPAFYLGFILSGVYTPFSVLCSSLFEHYRSGEPFGYFDRG